VFHLAYHQTLPTRSKTVPEIFSTMNRLKYDLEQARNLAITLDKEVGLDEFESNGCEVLQEKINEFNNNEEYDEIKKVKFIFISYSISYYLIILKNLKC